MKHLQMLTLALVLLVPGTLQADPLQPLVAAIDEAAAPFFQRTGEPVTARLAFQHRLAEGEPSVGEVRLVRQSTSQFSVSVTHPEVEFTLAQSPASCYLALPTKNLLFISAETESIPPIFTLTALDARLRKLGPEIELAAQFARAGGGRVLLTLLSGLGYRVLPGEAHADGQTFTIAKNGQSLAELLVASETPRLRRIDVQFGEHHVRVTPTMEWKAELPAPPAESESSDDAKRVVVSRRELETTFLRGLARAAEIQYEQVRYRPPSDRFVRGEYGYYWVKQGQRIVGLRGNSHNIGWQHGRFLKNEARKTLESTLYVVGLAYSIEKGSWFLDEIRDARARLDRHTPPEYLDELRGLAEGAELPFEEVHLASYFPELFHCSGFALQGVATADGKLYHGRILDYMTQIGLQNTATLFVVEKEGKIPFCNVGYAGFTGSVTGMNAAQVSLGEMGGRGEGDWDGVPMATLFRMALENAHTLEEAKAIFRDNPRTCEYYYIFADGKDRTAVGVYATPEKIEFINPGEAHPQLPRVFDDSLLLSAGDRYNSLCDRVEKQHGSLTREGALKLMDAPVAMKRANLHSVLMIPEDGQLHIANASPSQPAYTQPFYAYDLNELRAKLNRPARSDKR